MPSNASLEPANPLVAAFISSRLTTHRKDFNDSTIVEGASRYFLERDAGQPHLVHISVHIASSPFADQLLPEGHQQLLQHITHMLIGFAVPAASTKPGCLLTVDANLTALTEQDTATQASSIACLASLHATAASWQIRGILAGLCTTPAQPAAESSGAVHVFCSRPEQPFFVQPGPDHVLVVYPIWLPTGASRAYTACFMQWRQRRWQFNRSLSQQQCLATRVRPPHAQSQKAHTSQSPQEATLMQSSSQPAVQRQRLCKPRSPASEHGFTESRKTGDMPASTYSSGQALPVLVPQQCRQRVAEADGGFVTVTLQPHHLKSDSLDRLAWSVLTFQEYMSLHVKSFQAFIHSKMRKRMNMMMMELAQAKATFDA
eukprot:jgi/Astpho2/7221/Aster-01534